MGEALALRDCRSGLAPPRKNCISKLTYVRLRNSKAIVSSKTFLQRSNLAISAVTFSNSSLTLTSFFMVISLYFRVLKVFREPSFTQKLTLLFNKARTKDEFNSQTPEKLNLSKDLNFPSVLSLNQQYLLRYIYPIQATAKHSSQI